MSRKGESPSASTRAKMSASNARHGHRIKRKPTPTYNSWASMMQRCTNSKHMGFKNYGGRGITVCERWQVFENFLERIWVKSLKGSR